MSRVNDAIELINKGFCVIPIEERGKKPLVGWVEYQKRKPTRDEIENWFSKWPNANVAIVTGRISGVVVVDMDNEFAIEWVRSHLPATGTIVKTGKGYHAYYSYPQNSEINNKTRLVDGVDIRADGGYVIAPPSTHSTGTKYEWVKTDALVPYPLVGIDLSDVQAPLVVKNVGVGARNDMATKVAGSCIAKGLSSNETLIFLEDWNKGNDVPLAEKELVTIVKSVQKTHLRNNNILNITNRESLNINASIPPKKPDVCLPPASGLLKQIIDYIDKSTVRSIYDFNLAAAISLLGTVAGAKFQTQTALRTNFFTMAIGSSGVGKTQPISAISTLLSDSPVLEKYIGVNKVASGSAILQSLAERPVQLMLLDESPDLLSGIHNPLSAKANIPETLKELFSSANRRYIKTYADKEKKISIPYNNLCIYGTGTRAAFWNNFTSENVSDGFLARTYVFDYAGEIPKKKTYIDDTIPDELMSDLAIIGNFEPALSGNLGVPKPVMVKNDKDVDQFIEAWNEKYITLQNQYRDSQSGIESFYGRAEEHAMKLALLDAVSDLAGTLTYKTNFNELKLTINLKNIEWATQLTDYLITNTVRLISENIGNSAIDALCNKVLNYMRSHITQTKPYVTKKQLCNNIRNLDATNFTPVLETLVMRGAVEASKLETRSKHGEIIVFGFGDINEE